MNSKAKLIRRLSTWSGTLALIVAIGGFTPAQSAVAATRLAPQVNREGMVEVKVTPRSLAADAKVWEFDVAFNTHVTPIDGDPAQFSVLVDAQGKTHKALAWNGSPPGGHHRRGVLQFKPLAQSAGPVELRISGVGGVPARVFRWERD
jgi:hypothetical protein